MKHTHNAETTSSFRNPIKRNDEGFDPKLACNGPTQIQPEEICSSYHKAFSAFVWKGRHTPKSHTTPSTRADGVGVTGGTSDTRSNT